MPPQEVSVVTMEVDVFRAQALGEWTFIVGQTFGITRFLNRPFSKC